MSRRASHSFQRAIALSRLRVQAPPEHSLRPVSPRNVARIDWQMLRRFERAILGGRHGLRSLADERPMFLQSQAMTRPQFENCEPPPGNILLMAQVLVADDAKIEPSHSR